MGTDHTMEEDYPFEIGVPINISYQGDGLSV